MTMVERPEEHYCAMVNLLEYERVGEIIKGNGQGTHQRTAELAASPLPICSS